MHGDAQAFSKKIKKHWGKTTKIPGGFAKQLGIAMKAGVWAVWLHDEASQILELMLSADPEKEMGSELKSKLMRVGVFGGGKKAVRVERTSFCQPEY
jgi:hypothetical protein